MAIVRVLTPTALATRFRTDERRSFWCFASVTRAGLFPAILSGSFDGARQIAVGFERLYHEGGGVFPCNINLNQFYHGAVLFDLGDMPADWLSRSTTLPPIRQRSVSLLWDFVAQIGDPRTRSPTGCADAIGNILVPRNAWSAGVAARDSRNTLGGDDLGINTGRAMLQARVDVSEVVHQWLRRDRANHGFVFVGRSESYHGVPDLFTLTGSGFFRPWQQCADVLGSFRLQFDDAGVVEVPPPRM